MIHFKENLKNKAESLHTIKEYVDAFNDLSRIDYAISHVFTQSDLENARNLDNELYEKYPEISIMVNVANAMPRVNSPLSDSIVQQIPEVRNLVQDKFGIYAHILLKSKDIKEIKEFIDYVD